MVSVERNSVGTIQTTTLDQDEVAEMKEQIKVLRELVQETQDGLVEEKKVSSELRCEVNQLKGKARDLETSFSSTKAELKTNNEKLRALDVDVRCCAGNNDFVDEKLDKLKESFEENLAETVKAEVEKEVQRIVPLELEKTISEAVMNNNGTILEQVDQKLEVRITPLLNDIALINSNIMKQFAMLNNRQKYAQDSNSQQNPSRET